MTIDGQIDSLNVCEHLRQSLHSGCFACASGDGCGLALKFDVVRPGYVEGTFLCPTRLQSYDSLLHGGIICLLLDAAMTNCGFSLGRTLVTGDLQVRFLHPVPTSQSVRIRAWVDGHSNVLQIVRGQISLNGQIMARAVGKFVDKPNSMPSDSTSDESRIADNRCR